MGLNLSNMTIQAKYTGKPMFGYEPGKIYSIQIFGMFIKRHHLPGIYYESINEFLKDWDLTAPEKIKNI